MSYFPHAFEKMLVATAATTPFRVGNGTLNTLDLTAGQIGVVDAKTNLLLDTTTTPTYAATPMVYLAQGSFRVSDKLGSSLHGGYQETVKSKGINPKYVSKFYKTLPALPVQNIIKVANPGCALKCNTTYRLRLDVKGSPALRFLTHNLYRTLDATTGCCATGNPDVDANIVLLQWKDQINNYPLVKDFVKAIVWNKLITVATATATAAAALTMSDRTGIKAGQRVTFTPSTASSATASNITGFTFTVGTATNTVFSVGQVLTGTNVAAGTKIVELLTGNGGTGSTFRVDKYSATGSQTIASATALTLFVASTYVAATGAGAVALVAAHLPWEASATATANITTTSITPVFNENIISDYYDSTGALITGYVPVTGAAIANVVSYLELIGAYTQTEFLDCSFSPRDHVELQPIQIYASIVDDSGLACSASCFAVSETQQTFQGKGFREPLVRELILAKRYMQEDWKEDVRLREVLGDTSLAELEKGAKFVVYHILHSVPRKSNPSGMMDNDQYLIKVVAKAEDTVFEAYLNTLLLSSGNNVQLEILA